METNRCRAFLSELLATAFLGIVVLALGDDSNAPPGPGTNAFFLGLVTTAFILAFASNTNACLNPGRDLGPRMALITWEFDVHALFGDGWWVYGAWCATILGAVVVGALVYDVAVFVGGESPVNYPRTSVKRAVRKVRDRWKL